MNININVRNITVEYLSGCKPQFSSSYSIGSLLFHIYICMNTLTSTVSFSYLFKRELKKFVSKRLSNLTSNSDTFKVNKSDSP